MCACTDSVYVVTCASKEVVPLWCEYLYCALSWIEISDKLQRLGSIASQTEVFQIKSWLVFYFLQSSYKTYESNTSWLALLCYNVDSRQILWHFMKCSTLLQMRATTFKHVALHTWCINRMQGGRQILAILTISLLDKVCIIYGQGSVCELWVCLKFFFLWSDIL